MSITSLDYPGLVKTIPGLQYMTVPELLEKAAKDFNQDEFILTDENQYSFKEIYDLSNKVANWLISMGIKKGDKVGIMLPTCSEHVITFFGILTAGAVELPINIDFRGEELSYILAHGEVKVVFTNIDLLNHVLESWGIDNAQNCVSLEDNGNKKVHNFYYILNNYSTERPKIDINIDDPAGLVYTSGSTGFPKGALISHRYKFVFGAITDWSYRLTKRDRIMLVTPLFHGVALWHGIMGALYMGLACGLVKKFSVTNFFQQARKYRATIVYAVGAIPAMLYAQPESDGDRDHDIRMIWAFMCPRHLLEDFEKRFNMVVYDGLGQTECGRVLVNYPPIRKAGSLGLPYEFSDVKIVDEDDQEVQPEEVGEICVRAPSIMLGYFKNEEATLEAFKNGWLHTGDNGRMDEDGIVWFVDRKKDIIRRRGKVISSFEVQSTINTHEKVLESACIAVPSNLAEEEILAVVVLKEVDDPPQPEELAEWVKNRLAYYKVPLYWIYVDELPKTPSLRIQKFKLKQEINLDKAIELPVSKVGEPIRRKVASTRTETKVNQVFGESSNNQVAATLEVCHGVSLNKE